MEKKDVPAAKTSSAHEISPVPTGGSACKKGGVDRNNESGEQGGKSETKRAGDDRWGGKGQKESVWAIIQKERLENQPRVFLGVISYIGGQHMRAKTPNGEERRGTGQTKLP